MLKSEIDKKSPCFDCARVELDKLECSKDCEKLKKCQGEHLKKQLIRRIETVDLIKKCPNCGDVLRSEDGVVYCRECLTLVDRIDKGLNMKGHIERLLRDGKSIDFIVFKLNVVRPWVLKVKRDMPFEGGQV